MPEAQSPDLDTLHRALKPRYVLGRALGRGGMGVVYLATDVQLDRLVAIKVLPPDHAAQPAARARFLREARTAARMSHPNIVPIHAAEEWDGLVFYAMAYVEGETLEQRVKRSGPLKPLETARLIRDVAWALAYAHARGVIHRDVKPDNILFDRDTGRAMVTDFGIARVDAVLGNTGPQELFGTPEFMSPEQACGGCVDGRSDTYSLGVVAFYALSGRLLFNSRDPRQLIASHVTEPAPPVARVAPGVPSQLARAVDRCLAKNPEARFQRAEELANVMTRLLEEQSAPPVAVRAFVTESKWLAAPAHLYAFFVGGLVLPLVLLGITSTTAPLARLGIVAAALAAVATPVAFVWWRVRRFLATGYAWEDLVDLLQFELARHLEELAFTYGGGPTRMERVLRTVAYVALGGTAAWVALATYHLESVPDPTELLVAAATATVALLSAIVARLRTEHRTDPGAGRRLAFWRGRPGRWLFRLAAIRLTRRDGLASHPAAESPPRVASAFTAAPTPSPNG